jgi:hypothetical protein
VLGWEEYMELHNASVRDIVEASTALGDIRLVYKDPWCPAELPYVIMDYVLGEDCG